MCDPIAVRSNADAQYRLLAKVAHLELLVHHFRTYVLALVKSLNCRIAQQQEEKDYTRTRQNREIASDQSDDRHGFALKL